LRLWGRVRSFSVAATELGDEVRMTPRERTDRVTIILRPGEAWADVEARRTSDLTAVRAVLRRSGEVTPSAVVPPTKLASEPYDTWDPRTLWVLDFLRRDLQAPELRLNDTVMANFLTAKGQVVDEDDARRPNLDAVRLLGRQLHEHPEACARNRLRRTPQRHRSAGPQGHGQTPRIL
jgi:hypothetical protein